MKKVLVPGIVENSSKKFTEGEIDYNYTSDENVNGFGRFVSKDVALTVIKAHRDYLKLKNEKDQPFAMTFGKEALLSILAQKGCEGVRFYFGKRDKDQWEPGSPYANRDGITLVAIGVNSDNKDHGCCRLAERFDCKTLVGILYEQRLFARIIGVLTALRHKLANRHSGKHAALLLGTEKR